MKTTLQTLNQIPSQGFVMKNGEKVQTNFMLVPTETFMRYFNEVLSIYEEIKQQNQTDIFIEKILDESDDSLIVNTTIEVLPDKNYNYTFIQNLRKIRNIIKNHLKNKIRFTFVLFTLLFIRDNYHEEFNSFIKKICDFSGEITIKSLYKKLDFALGELTDPITKILPLKGEINWMVLNKFKKIHVDFKDTPTIKVFIHDMKLHIIITKKDPEYKNYLYNFKFVFPAIISYTYSEYF